MTKSFFYFQDFRRKKTTKETEKKAVITKKTDFLSWTSVTILKKKKIPPLNFQEGCEDIKLHFISYL
jgi:hypothetical protein